MQRWGAEIRETKLLNEDHLTRRVTNVGEASHLKRRQRQKLQSLTFPLAPHPSIIVMETQ